MSLYYLTSIIKNCLFTINSKQTLRRLHYRSILGDKIIRLTENTLLGRMMVYLNGNVNITDTLGHIEDTNIINDLVHGKTSGLRNLSVDQIANLFCSANLNILSHNKQNLRKVLNILDVECCLRIHSMEPSKILKLLRAYMHVVPNRITEYKFYQYVTDDIDKRLEFVSKKELLQFIFYIGLQKKVKKSQIVLRKCLRNINKDFLESLTVEDLCIICNSAYRTNTKINNLHLLQKVKQSLNENLSLMKDPALLITFIKTIRQNHYQDEDLLSTISCTIFFNNTVQYYSFSTICHILSLYADYAYYDEQLLKLLVNESFKQLENCKEVTFKGLHLTEQLRAKDIVTLLWVLSSLGYTEIDENIFETLIVPKIKQRISIGEYKNDMDQLLDTLLYMWMLNYRAKDLLKYALSKVNLPSVEGNSRKSKARFCLLLSIIKCEDKQLFNELNISSLPLTHFNQTSQIQNRPVLQRIFQTMKSSSVNLSLHQIEMNCQIAHLNIVGIQACHRESNTAVNVEVLDDYTCVKNKDCHPTGFMQLKLRILEASEVPLLTVDKNEVEEMNDVELREFLESELNLIFEVL